MPSRLKKNRAQAIPRRVALRVDAMFLFAKSAYFSPATASLPARNFSVSFMAHSATVDQQYSNTCIAVKVSPY